MRDRPASEGQSTRVPTPIEYLNWSIAEPRLLAADPEQAAYLAHAKVVPQRRPWIKLDA
jgi:hypothetical protein